MANRRTVTFVCNSDLCGAQFTVGSTSTVVTRNAAKQAGWTCWDIGRHWCPDCADCVRGKRRLPDETNLAIRVVPGRPRKAREAS